MRMQLLISACNHFPLPSSFSPQKVYTNSYVGMDILFYILFHGSSKASKASLVHCFTSRRLKPYRLNHVLQSCHCRYDKPSESLSSPFLPINTQQQANNAVKIINYLFQKYVSTFLYIQNWSSPGCHLRSHSPACIKNHLFIVGIGPILNKELRFIFRSYCSHRTYVYTQVSVLYDKFQV